MPVNTPHKQYTEFIGQWTRCRDAHGGNDAVKARGTAYLPMLEGMAPAEAFSVVDPTSPQAVATKTAYQGYLHRAMFYPATGRTVLGLVGMLFGKAPTPPDVAGTIAEHFKDVTLSGVSLSNFAIDLSREVLMTGRAGILIDYPLRPLGATDARPYWLLYRAEDIINWSTSRIGGHIFLTRVVLRERVPAADNDEFSSAEEIRYRVLRLDTDRRYTVQLYIQNPDKKHEYLPQEVITPLRRGEPLDFIPFQFVAPTSLSPDVEHPPLIDLVDVNLSHYRTSADREHGAHFTALPTPWVKGHSLAPGETLGVGSGTAWVFPSAEASAGMLEFSGAGLGELRSIMEEKRLLMATLGARMLETQRNVQEAAQTVRMRHSGEGSALGILGDMISAALTNVAAWHLFWAGMERERIGDQHRVSLNPEIMDELTSEDIKSLVAAWQAGAISKKTLYYNMQWGEWTRPDVDFDQEEEDINEEVETATEALPQLPKTEDDDSDDIDDDDQPPQRGAQRREE